MWKSRDKLVRIGELLNFLSWRVLKITLCDVISSLSRKRGDYEMLSWGAWNLDA